MEMETLLQFLRHFGMEQGIYLWVLMLAGREIRRLYQARYREQEQYSLLLRRELKWLQDLVYQPNKKES